MACSVAIIGTGDSDTAPSSDGFAMAHLHADGYTALNTCELTACADLVTSRAKRFADKFDIPKSGVYSSHQQLLQSESPDIISICTPPSSHAEIILDCMRTSDVQAIHCEKPIATTWRDCERIKKECNNTDVQLTFNVQRRLSGPYQRGKELLEAGEIGKIKSMEITGRNLFDDGTHWIDLAGFLNDEQPVTSVIGQIDYREENLWFGAHNENQAFAQWVYENGVRAVVRTGVETTVNDPHHRITGTEGILEIGRENGPAIRIHRFDGPGWKIDDAEGENCHHPKKDTPSLPGYVDRATAEVVDSLLNGKKSLLDHTYVMNATEIIFSVWESSRKRGRIELPLEITDNPLESMVESGQLTPK